MFEMRGEHEVKIERIMIKPNQCAAALLSAS
jgi:hypothetical protein